MKIFSSAFEETADIPDKYTCKGENINPDLSFTDIPANTKSLVLIMDDPDAPRPGGFTHWIIFNIPPDTKMINENSAPPGIEAPNSAGQNKYTGPCPPSGVHRYYFKLYALDTILEGKVTGKVDLESAMSGHVIEEAELMGKFAH